MREKKEVQGGEAGEERSYAKAVIGAVPHLEVNNLPLLFGKL